MIASHLPLPSTDEAVFCSCILPFSEACVGSIWWLAHGGSEAGASVGKCHTFQFRGGTKPAFETGACCSCSFRRQQHASIPWRLATRSSLANNHVRTCGSLRLYHVAGIEGNICCVNRSHQSPHWSVRGCCLHTHAVGNVGQRCQSVNVNPPGGGAGYHCIVVLLLFS
jgi:hypothetical protein